ncbi:MAG: hypothetical protein ACBZ72_00375 [Candidatus Bathyarchaeia archaeon]|jgi:hypothetical protein
MYSKLLKEYGVSKRVSDVLFFVFLDDELEKYLPLFRQAVKQPISLKPFISELQKELNTGAFSHTTSAMYHFLATDDNFGIFTRDYVRRCCDMVEYITKRKVAPKLRLESEVEKKPLGRVIGLFNRQNARHFPNGLLEALAQFNEVIYCPAKHEHVTSEESRMFSVADAIAVTFITVRLCQQLDDFQRKY